MRGIESLFLHCRALKDCSVDSDLLNSRRGLHSPPPSSESIFKSSPCLLTPSVLQLVQFILINVSGVSLPHLI